MPDFVEWLSGVMRDRGMSQTDLAERAGASQSMLSQILSRQRLPAHKTVVKLARALNVPEDQALDMAGLLHVARGVIVDADIAEMTQLMQSLSKRDRAGLLANARALLALDSVASDKRSNAERQSKSDQ